MENKEINIVVGANKKYFIYARFLYEQIIKKTHHYVNFFVLTYDSKPSLEMDKYLNFSSDKGQINIVDLNTKGEKLTNDDKLNAYLSPLFIPEIFKDLDKVLYLDLDLYINGDVSKILDINISNVEIAAVTERSYFLKKQQIGYRSKLEQGNEDLYIKRVKEYGYFNSGVILFNIENSYEKQNELISWMKENIKSRHRDQDAFNFIYGQHKQINSKWNRQLASYWKFKYAPLRLLTLIFRGKDMILHMTGPNNYWSKPEWQLKYLLPFGRKWLKAWKEFNEKIEKENTP